MNVRTRLVAGSIGLVLTCALSVGGWFAAAALSVAVGYKAKTLCSGVFVSKLKEAAVLADLQADDLAILRHIGVSLDANGRSVRASFRGIVTRHARYRDGLGCTLVLDGVEPPALPKDTDHRLSGIAPASGRGAATERATEWNPAGGGTIAPLDGAVARAFTEPDPSRRRRTLAVVVARHGRIIAARYAEGIEAKTPLGGWSMTKSVMNALVGVLVREGRLRLDASVPVPEWRRAGDDRGSITLDHLLHMSSGLRFNEGMASPRSDVLRMLFD